MSNSFTSLGLSKALLDVIADQNYAAPYPVQKDVIPAVLKGRDLLGIAPTGSGKTAGFVLPILERIQHKSSANSRYIKVLVLVPTRELSVQVGDVFRLFAERLPQRVKTLSVYGGVSVNPQMMKLQGTDILVATPGRLLDLVSSNSVKLSEVSILVIDEADQMLNLGFREEMNRILALLPSAKQNLLFSATLSPEVLAIKELLLRNPEIIRVEELGEDLSLIRQLGYYIDPERKGPLLRYLLKKEDMKQVLVDIRYNDRWAVRKGSKAADFQLRELEEILRGKEFSIKIDLHLGRGTYTVYTCDCSLEYVRINSEYMT